MKEDDQKKLRQEAKLIFESDMRFAQVLASLEMAYKAGKKSAES